MPSCRIGFHAFPFSQSRIVYLRFSEGGVHFLLSRLQGHAERLLRFFRRPDIRTNVHAKQTNTRKRLLDPSFDELALALLYDINKIELRRTSVCPNPCGGGLHRARKAVLGTCEPLTISALPSSQSVSFPSTVETFDRFSFLMGLNFSTERLLLSCFNASATFLAEYVSVSGIRCTHRFSRRVTASSCPCAAFHLASATSSSSSSRWTLSAARRPPSSDVARAFLASFMGNEYVEKISSKRNRTPGSECPLMLALRKCRCGQRHSCRPAPQSCTPFILTYASHPWSTRGLTVCLFQHQNLKAVLDRL